ncbi:hypothetical protein N7534_003134 [Penicillium rubens]|nr:hypothetical protein N7534_003134 [Penicillium rubens]
MPDHTEADCRRLRALGALNRMSLPRPPPSARLTAPFEAAKQRRPPPTALLSPARPPAPLMAPSLPTPPAPAGPLPFLLPPPRASPPSNEAQASGVVGKLILIQTVEVNVVLVGSGSNEC